MFIVSKENDACQQLGHKYTKKKHSSKTIL